MIKVENVVKKFDDKAVLNHLSLEIPSGIIMGLIGKSGAGKSSFIRLLAGLDEVDSGIIKLEGNQKVSMVFQDFGLLASKTAYENIELALRIKHIPTERRQQKIEEILNFVGLLELKNRYPSEMSGGQKQRIGIARALVSEPDILLCDEITSALDPETKSKIGLLLKKINEEKKTTILLVTHEMMLAKDICDQIAVMDGGKIIELNSVENICLLPQKTLTKSFMNELISQAPSPENIVNNFRYIYELLLSQEQYFTFQKEKPSGLIYNSQSLKIKNKQFFYLNFASNIRQLKVDSIVNERLGDNCGSI